MTTHIIYHDNCLDGFASALVAREYLPNDIKFYPAQYQKPLGLNKEDIAPNDEIYILDFSLSKEDIWELTGLCALVVVIDHHKTAQWMTTDNDLKAINNLQIYMNQDRCGALLIFEFFHGHSAYPRFLKLIDDRDRWIWQYDDTEPFSEALMTKEKDFDVWSAFYYYDDFVESLIKEGRTMLKVKESQIKHALQFAHNLEIAPGEFVMAVNGSAYVSEVGHRLAELPENTSKIGCCYWRLTDGSWKFSLRSVEGVDTTRISKLYGGGGHTGASGFVISDSDFRGHFK